MPLLKDPGNRMKAQKILAFYGSLLDLKFQVLGWIWTYDFHRLKEKNADGTPKKLRIGSGMDYLDPKVMNRDFSSLYNK